MSLAQCSRGALVASLRCSLGESRILPIGGVSGYQAMHVLFASAPFAPASHTGPCPRKAAYGIMGSEGSSNARKGSKTEDGFGSQEAPQEDCAPQVSEETEERPLAEAA
jgi:hypothetical protein